MTTTKFGDAILARHEALAAFTEGEGCLTRTYLTAKHREAGERILGWMREAGMAAAFDAMGNVVGRYEGAAPGAPVLMTGSHMDTVVDAGRYDGSFGILSPIACVADLNARGKRLPHAIEVVAFGDEEGVRFGATLLGSRAMAGRFDLRALEAKDKDGVTLRQAMKDFGGDPEAIASLKRDPAKVAAFVETHIEQGPVLLDEGLPVGVVTAITGTSRVKARVEGVAGHAGTVPMAGRRDALTAAAEMALAVERYCHAGSGGLVGTVGKLAIDGGGAINVIPGGVSFTVDVRSPDDAARREAVEDLRGRCESIAEGRGVSLSWDLFFELESAPCDPRLMQRLARCVSARGVKVRTLPSGAGHDAMEMARLVPSAMLFVRCGAGGISHNPAETLSAEDAEVATAVLLDFMESFDAREVMR